MTFYMLAEDPNSEAELMNSLIASTILSLEQKKMSYFHICVL